MLPHLSECPMSYLLCDFYKCTILRDKISHRKYQFYFNLVENLKLVRYFAYYDKLFLYIFTIQLPYHIAIIIITPSGGVSFN